jgi:hypothetical protein
LAHRLDGAIAKFNRSKEQFDELIGEMDAFFNGEPKPYSSVGEFDTDAWEWIERFQVLEEPPPRLGVILGDCVHNLRSCLDHVIWQVTLLDGGTPDHRTQFPIASYSKKQFDAMARKQIPGLNAKHRAMVKRLQPYNAGKRATRHPLHVLATLSNTDKHQIVNPTYSFTDTDPDDFLDKIVGNYRGEGKSPAYKFWIAKRGQPLHHGTPWLRVEWRRDREAPGQVEMEYPITFGIAFGDIGLNAAQFPQMAGDILKIVQAFMADFPETEFIEADGEDEP